MTGLGMLSSLMQNGNFFFFFLILLLFLDLLFICVDDFFSLYYIGVGLKVCVGLNVCVDLLLALFIHFT